MSLLNRIVKSNGQEIGPSSIISLTYAEAVNSGANLEPGCVSVATLDMEYREGVSLTQGEEFEYHVVDSGSGADTLIGVFISEKPTRASSTTYSVSAYDRLSKSEKDVSEWLSGLSNQFPIALYDFAKLVCEQCGLTLYSGSITNGSYQVKEFYADGVTGRQLLSWVAQASASFCRCTASGYVEFGWYTPATGTLLSTGFGKERAAVRLAGETLRTSSGEVYRVGVETIGYYSDSLSYEDYVSAAPVKVQIKGSNADIGTVYPADEAGENAYVIQDNMLLTAESADDLQDVARNIYEVVSQTPFTPFSVDVPETMAFRAGRSISVYPAKGTEFMSYIQTCTWTSGRMTLSATGDPTRASSSAVNSKKYGNLDGKLLEITANVDGLKVTAVKKGEVRSEFALDDSSVRIKSGLISFEGNTIKIESDNFSLDESGNVSGTGEFSSTSGGSGAEVNTSRLTSGGLYMTRTLKSGDNASVVDLYGIGSNAAFGYLTLYGTLGNGAEGQGPMAQIWGDFDGAREVLKNGSGHGTITMNASSGNAVFAGDVDVQGPIGLGVSKTVSCQNLNCWGDKTRVVPSSVGNVKMAAFETPEPCFADSGSAQLDESGLCLVALDPIFAEVIERLKGLRWLITPTSDGTAWVEKRDGGAMVHGTPGLTFDWMCIGTQRGYGDVYAERCYSQQPIDYVQVYQELDYLDTIQSQSMKREYDMLPNYDWAAFTDSLF